MAKELNPSRSAGKEILVGALASILAGVAVNAANVLISGYVPILQKWHWTSWFWLGVCTYVLSCMVADVRYRSKKRPGFFGWLTVPVWSALKAFGSQPVAKVSYVVLLIVPVLAYFSKPEIMGLPFNLLPLPLNLKLSYFASWFFAISLIIYASTCPKEINKINPVEKIRTLNVVLNQISDANIKIEGENEDIDPVHDLQNLGARTLCFLFYGLGAAAAAIVLFRSAVKVLYA
ncbi:hypothetical protein [Teredinibacter turnerae]|uniref:hypothetical protein n=1 Tax=Teredinibacter turnerae TaxID=2426 RepID=UPI00048BBB52|nr:hypothetical protein [Teredinibacter turnerae]